MTDDACEPPALTGTPRVSVALATYNGERHLLPQLESLAGQSLTPFEVVVSDDASTDRSVDIVTAFAERAPFEVTVHRRHERGGVATNFSNALSRVTGTLVAPCDQDDIWAPSKLEVLVREFHEPSVSAAACDARLVDAAGASLDETLWERQGFKGSRRASFLADPFASLLRENPISGATTMLRSDVVRRALPVPDGAIHDWWLLLIASSLGRIRLVPDALVSYRQHGTNAIGARTISSRAAWRERRRRQADPVWTEDSLFRALADHDTVPEDRRMEVDAKLALLDVRADRNVEVTHRLLRILRALLKGDYHRYARGVRSALVDLLDSRGQRADR